MWAAWASWAKGADLAVGSGSGPSTVMDVCVELLGRGSAVAVGSWAMVAGANGTPADGAVGRRHRMEGGGGRAGSGWRSVVTSCCRRRMGGRLMMGSDCCRRWRSCWRKGAVDGRRSSPVGSGGAGLDGAAGRCSSQKTSDEGLLPVAVRGVRQ
ncbi:hypothetical protein ACLOJK_018071 [Asimina triloba]